MTEIVLKIMYNIHNDGKSSRYKIMFSFFYFSVYLL